MHDRVATGVFSRYAVAALRTWVLCRKNAWVPYCKATVDRGTRYARVHACTETNREREKDGGELGRRGKDPPLKHDCPS